MINKKYFQKNVYLFLLLTIIFFLTNPLTINATEQDGIFVIGPEDILEISVWKDPDLTKQLIVRPDGRISFPLIGEIEAGGQKVKWLQEHIMKRIREYIPDAMVTVMVAQINSMKIYVVGKVVRPGEYRIGRKINVMQTLALAGGLSPFADEDNILILRQDNKESKKLSFNYNKVKKGKEIEQNIWLKNGDVVVIR